MNILILESGAYNYFWHLTGQLLYNGHRVYVYNCDPSMIKLYQDSGYPHERFDPKEFDLVIAANLFNQPEVEYVFNFLRLKVPTVVISWGHPLEEIETWLRRMGREGFNDWLEEKRCFLWIPCPFACEEYRMFGMKQGIYAPLGLFDRMPDRGIYRYRWLQPEAIPLKPIWQWEEGVKPWGDYPTGVEMVYMGNMPEKPAIKDAALEKICRELVEQAWNNPERSRSQASDLWQEWSGMEVDRGLNVFFEFQKNYLYHHAKETREKFVHRLKKEFGSRFLLIGDAWRKQNLDAMPSHNVNRSYLYRNTPISLDFGSLSFETCYFPRVLEIFQSGGLFLGYQRPDSEEIFGTPLASALSFRNEEELLAKVQLLISSPSLRHSYREAATRHCLTHRSISKSLGVLFKAMSIPEA